MIVTVEAGSPVPPYEQLREQLTTMIRSQVLAPGTRLPPIRQLAGDLALATGTVARAYRELESDGLVSSNGRRGTVVAAPTDALARQDVDQELRSAAEAFALRVRHLGIPHDRAMAAATTALSAE